MLLYAGGELPTRAVTSPQDGETQTELKTGLTLKAEERNYSASYSVY
jgi:hypothetical protein